MAVQRRSQARIRQISFRLIVVSTADKRGAAYSSN